MNKRVIEHARWCIWIISLRIPAAENKNAAVMQKRRSGLCVGRAIASTVDDLVIVDSDSTVVGAAARSFSFDLYRFPVVYINNDSNTLGIPAKTSACMFYHVIHR